MTDRALRDKLEKLVWMALDQGGNEHQMDQAGATVFRLCRKAKVSAKVSAKAFGALFSGYTDKAPSAPPPFVIVMPFGKYKGRSLKWIAENDLNYLDWAFDNMDALSESMREAIKGVIQHARKAAT